MTVEIGITPRVFIPIEYNRTTSNNNYRNVELRFNLALRHYNRYNDNNLKLLPKVILFFPK